MPYPIPNSRPVNIELKREPGCVDHPDFQQSARSRAAVERARRQENARREATNIGRIRRGEAPLPLLEPDKFHFFHRLPQTAQTYVTSFLIDEEFKALRTTSVAYTDAPVSVCHYTKRGAFLAMRPLAYAGTHCFSFIGCTPEQPSPTSCFGSITSWCNGMLSCLLFPAAWTLSLGCLIPCTCGGLCIGICLKTCGKSHHGLDLIEPQTARLLVQHSSVYSQQIDETKNIAADEKSTDNEIAISMTTQLIPGRS